MPILLVKSHKKICEVLDEIHKDFEILPPLSGVGDPSGACVGYH